MNNGPRGTATNAGTVGTGTPPSTLGRVPGTLCTTTRPTDRSLERYEQALVQRLSKSLGSEPVQRAIFAMLGNDSFSVGVVYGMTKNLVVSVYQLGELFKTLALAEYDDLKHSGTFMQRLRAGTAMSSFPTLMMAGELYAASLVWPQIDRMASDAAAERNALFDAIKDAFEHPGAVFKKMKADQLKRYADFKALLAAHTVAGNFNAGALFGDLLLDVLLIADGVTTLAKLATKIPALLRMLPKLEEIVPALREAVATSRQAFKSAAADAKAPLAPKGGNAAVARARPATVARPPEPDPVKPPVDDDVAPDDDADTPDKVAQDRQRITDLAKDGKIDEARQILQPYVDDARDASTEAEKQSAMDSIVQRLDVSSDQPKMFWSGDKDAAAAMASASGQTILEQTPGGSVIDGWKDLNDTFSWDPNALGPHGWDLWGDVSENYASDATGSIDVVQTAAKFPAGGPTWLNREWPAIQSSGSVTDITIIKIDGAGNVIDTLPSLDVNDPATAALFSPK